jgi:hypothetical protein
MVIPKLKRLVSNNLNILYLQSVINKFMFVIGSKLSSTINKTEFEFYLTIKKQLYFNSNYWDIKRKKGKFFSEKKGNYFSEDGMKDIKCASIKELDFIDHFNRKIVNGSTEGIFRHGNFSTTEVVTKFPLLWWYMVPNNLKVSLYHF